jgi:hypothetical protein
MRYRWRRPGVTLEQVLTDQAYADAAALGGKLTDGIETTAAANGFDWRAHRLYNRSGYTHGPYLPSNAADARDSFDAELFNIQRIYVANRGIWEAIDSAGPGGRDPDDGRARRPLPRSAQRFPRRVAAMTANESDSG